jgi:ABC-type cobalamin transport system permease subunit
VHVDHVIGKRALVDVGSIGVTLDNLVHVDDLVSKRALVDVGSIGGNLDNLVHVEDLVSKRALIDADQTLGTVTGTVGGVLSAVVIPTVWDASGKVLSTCALVRTRFSYCLLATH